VLCTFCRFADKHTGDQRCITDHSNSYFNVDISCYLNNMSTPNWPSNWIWHITR